MGIGKAPSIGAADTDVTPVKKKRYRRGGEKVFMYHFKNMWQHELVSNTNTTFYKLILVISRQ